MVVKRKVAPADARPGPDLSDYPVREYVASMAGELSLMARDDGDQLLAQTLDLAVQLAQRPI